MEVWEGPGAMLNRTSSLEICSKGLQVGLSFLRVSFWFSPREDCGLGFGFLKKFHQDSLIEGGSSLSESGLPRPDNPCV